MRQGGLFKLSFFASGGLKSQACTCCLQMQQCKQMDFYRGITTKHCTRTLALFCLMSAHFGPLPSNMISFLSLCTLIFDERANVGFHWLNGLCMFVCFCLCVCVCVHPVAAWDFTLPTLAFLRTFWSYYWEAHGFYEFVFKVFMKRKRVNTSNTRCFWCPRKHSEESRLSFLRIPGCKVSAQNFIWLLLFEKLDLFCSLS